MLISPGDLIPVEPSATTIPWTRRKSQILNYLHRGPVTFSTLVYDTNVGDISALSTYFNPDRISVSDLNSRFGQCPSSGEMRREDEVKVGSEHVVKPRLLLYPEHNLNNSQVKVQRTLKWVLSNQDSEDSDQSRPPSTDLTSGNSASISPGARDLYGSRSSSSENLTKGSGSRPSSSLSHNLPARISPIGEPMPPSSGRRAAGNAEFGRANSELGHYGITMPPGRANTELGLPVQYGGLPVRGNPELGQPAHYTMPNLNSALDSVWKDPSMRGLESSWAARGTNHCPW